jgi:hypothetical protein
VGGRESGADRFQNAIRLGHYFAIGKAQNRKTMSVKIRASLRVTCHVRIKTVLIAIDLND